MDQLKQNEQPEFPVAQDLGARDWGSEELLVHSEGKYIVKRLYVKAGYKGGLQFHRVKDEAGYLVSGQLILRFDDGCGGLEEKTVNPGDFFRFPPGVVHQEEAITDCLIIETSTPHFNDRVRVEGHYGLGEPVGLPTTSIEDVVAK